MKDAAEDKAGLALLKQSISGTKPSTELNVHIGPLASGAAVVAHRETFDSLLAQHRGLLGIDMEAYGIASAALGNGKPRPVSVTIKGVCDFGDHTKADDYQEYAARVSVGFLMMAAQKFL